ncbi:unnamed protein product [Clavelina lepadiformis]|uniref:Uncharacterized protein n=1 Tax=Clavelina lepadiformis TaxID=159417 RepID=A0ABP0FD75_CLALP
MKLRTGIRRHVNTIPFQSSVQRNITAITTDYFATEGAMALQQSVCDSFSVMRGFAFNKFKAHAWEDHEYWGLMREAGNTVGNIVATWSRLVMVKPNMVSARYCFLCFKPYYPALYNSRMKKTPITLLSKLPN